MSTDSKRPPEGLTYKDAGVDIDAGNALIERIKPHVARTRRPEMLAGLGGFGGLFQVPSGMREPVLVSGTDGVGTKLKLAQQLNRHDTIGVDLVAMCVNDVLVQGAEPLFFLDYFATGKLNNDVAEAVVAGIANGCELAGCALVGGETAEMPDMYAPGEYDLAGFNVGVVEKSELIDGRLITAGDVIIGLPSSGPHSNGYSLIRKVIEVSQADLDSDLDGQSLGDALLAPTAIYVKPVLALRQPFDLHGMAHITGGGLTENIIRVVPEPLGVEIDLARWQRPAVFDWLQREGNIADSEMLRTFNCGVGYCLVVDPAQVEPIRQALADYQIDAQAIGQIVESAADTTGRVRVLGT